MSGLHLQCVWTRTRTTGTEDVVVTTHDHYSTNITNWSEADMTAAASLYGDFWSALGAYYTPTIRLVQVRCYEGYDGDGSPGNVDYIRTSNVGGSASGAMLPPQVACSVTEMTEFRKTWGRFYLPNPAVAVLNADGSYSATFVDAVADAAATLYNGIYGLAAGMTPIVWSTTNYAGLPAAVDPIPVESVRVDDIPDIQRRRRYESVNLRETRAVPTA